MINACSITTTGVDFGTYDSVLRAAKSATGKVTLTCTKGAVASVKLDNGEHFAASSRNMTSSGNNSLSYGLFSDALWSDSVERDNLCDTY